MPKKKKKKNTYAVIHRPDKINNPNILCSGSDQANLRKNIFACIFSVHSLTSLSRHGHVCLIRLRFTTYFSHQWVTQMIVSSMFTGHMRTCTETIEILDLGNKGII